MLRPLYRHNNQEIIHNSSWANGSLKMPERLKSLFKLCSLPIENSKNRPSPHTGRYPTPKSDLGRREGESGSLGREPVSIGGVEGKVQGSGLRHVLLQRRGRLGADHGRRLGTLLKPEGDILEGFILSVGLYEQGRRRHPDLKEQVSGKQENKSSRK